MLLVGRGALEGGDAGFVETQIGGELAAMMGKMAKDAVGDRHVAGLRKGDPAADFEGPRAKQVHVETGFESAAGVGHTFVESGGHVCARGG